MTKCGRVIRSRHDSRLTQGDRSKSVVNSIQKRQSLLHWKSIVAIMTTHWWHQRLLSLEQPMVPSVITKLVLWQLLLFTGIWCRISTNCGNFPPKYSQRLIITLHLRWTYWETIVTWSILLKIFINDAPIYWFGWCPGFEKMTCIYPNHWC